MKKEKKLDIIVPVYHEEENIEELIKGINGNVKTSHFLTLVFQDRKDPALKIVDSLKNKFKNIRIIFTKDGIGVVKALKAGFSNTDSDIIAVMMGDLSDNPKDIDKMVEKVNEGYDFVCASRYSSNGKKNGGPIVKGFLSFIACKTLRILTGIPTNDSTNAFKCFKKDFIKSVKIESAGGFELPLELAAKAFISGKKITEIPTIWNERKKGKSKFKLIQWFPHYLHWYIFAIINKV